MHLPPANSIREAGLPDGIFEYQKYQFWCILEGLGMKNFGIFYIHLEFFDHMVYFMANWLI
jgi:hypothetical protein